MEDVRCAISPDGLHLLTLSACGKNAISCEVHHYAWKTIRNTCMALDAAEQGKHHLCAKDRVVRMPTKAAREIMAFLLPGSGIHRRYQMLRNPYSGDTTDILPEL